MAVQTYRDLLVWQKAMDLVVALYEVTRKFPKEELYGLTNQLRRAVVSVPSNVAEGQGRGNGDGFAYFLRIAMGSLQETQTQLILSHRLAYLRPDELDVLDERIEELGRLIRGLQKSLSPQC